MTLNQTEEELKKEIEYRNKFDKSKNKDLKDLMNFQLEERLIQLQQDKKLFNDFIEELKERINLNGYIDGQDKINIIKDLDNLKKEYFGETKGDKK